MDHQILTRRTTFEGKKLSVEEKKTVVKLFLEDQRSSGTTQEDFARKRAIKSSTFGDWVKNYRTLDESGMNNFHERKGRPQIFTPPITKRICKTMVEEIKDQKAPDTQEFQKICVSEIAKDLGRNGKAEVVKLPSKTTLWKLKKEINAFKKAVQKKPPARIVATPAVVTKRSFVGSPCQS